MLINDNIFIGDFLEQILSTNCSCKTIQNRGSENAMTIKKRFKTANPMKDYTHMKRLASRLDRIFPEYEFTPKSNGYEIDIKSEKLRYKQVTMQRVKIKNNYDIGYQLSIPEKGRSFDCGRMPELKNIELLKKAMSLEIKAIDGSW